MKVGDKVKILRKEPGNHTGSMTAHPGAKDYNEVGVGKVGYITEISTTLQVCASMDDPEALGYYGRFREEDLELLPQTQELEDVYTHCPFPELEQAVEKKAKEYFPKTRIQGEYIFYNSRYPTVLDSISSPIDSYVGGKKEVSIPQFLTLLEEFGKRKKEVKVQLNAKLVALVDTTKEVVNIQLNGLHVADGDEPGTLTFQQLLDFQQALKGGGHGFTKKQVGVKFPSYEVRNGVIDHLINCKVPVSSGCKGKYESDYPDLFWTGNEVWIGEAEGNVLTIEQFFQLTKTFPLPKLAGYEVKKVKEGDPFPSSCSLDWAPSEGLSIGCQFISLAQFEALMEAITTK